MQHLHQAEEVKDMKVELVSSTQNPELVIADAARTCYDS